MNTWLKNELEKQFDRAERLGWLPHFFDAVEAYTDGIFDAADLIGIASRETNLDPKWLTKAGDNGNGFGLMQADRRSFPEFTSGSGWRDAKTGILFGAKVLLSKWNQIKNGQGKALKVQSSKTKKWFHFTGKAISGVLMQRTAIAGYNCGLWSYYAYSNNQSVDKYTTGKNYSSDVMERAAFFRPLMKNWHARNSANSHTRIVEPVTSQNYDDPAREVEIITLPSHKETEQNQANNENSSISDSEQSQTNESAETSKIKDITDKYVKHCKDDSAKNIALVICARIGAAITAMWTFGITGKIFLILIGLVIIGSVIYAFTYYRKRLWAWIKAIIKSFLAE